MISIITSLGLTYALLTEAELSALSLPGAGEDDAFDDQVEPARDMLRDGMIAALQGTSASPSDGAHLLTLENRDSAALMWETVHRAQHR